MPRVELAYAAKKAAKNNFCLTQNVKELFLICTKTFSAAFCLSIEITVVWLFDENIASPLLQCKLYRKYCTMENIKLILEQNIVARQTENIIKKRT
jgi:hypothetical protein